MSAFSEKIAFLKGLAEGLEIKEDSKEGKMLLGILDALETAVKEFQEVNDHIDAVDESLADLEDELEDFEDEDEDEEDDDDGMIECECPHCGNSIFFDSETFDLSEDHNCPNCGKPLFDDDESESENKDKK